MQAAFSPASAAARPSLRRCCPITLACAPGSSSRSQQQHAVRGAPPPLHAAASTSTAATTTTFAPPRPSMIISTSTTITTVTTTTTTTGRRSLGGGSSGSNSSSSSSGSSSGSNSSSFTYTQRAACRMGTGGGEQHAQDRAERIVAQAKSLPRLVVFDLDYTLWPFWCETMTKDDEPYLYPEAMPVLNALRKHGVRMAVASRTPTPEVAAAFLRKLGLAKAFDDVQLVPAADGFDRVTAQKDTCHFPNLHRALLVPYSDMLFFDDDDKNVVKVARLGVCSVPVNRRMGITVDLLEEALGEFERHPKAPPPPPQQQQPAR